MRVKVTPYYCGKPYTTELTNYVSNKIRSRGEGQGQVEYLADQVEQLTAIIAGLIAAQSEMHPEKLQTLPELLHDHGTELEFVDGS